MLRIYLMNFLLAVSTTIGMTFIPFLITDSLGLSLMMLGLLEGVTEFLSNAFRLLNGVLFDRIKNKRYIFIFSTALAFTSKALLFLPSPLTVLFSKIFERMANGTFAAPRDAFVAGNAKSKGMALGLLNVSKSFGCVIGPLIVALAARHFGAIKDNIFFFITICCILSFPALIFSFTLKVDHVEEKAFSMKELKTVIKSITPILFLVFLFFLGRFNDGLLMMYLRHNNYPQDFYLSTIAIFNAIMMVSSPIIGSQVDKGQLKRIVYVTIWALCVFNISFYYLDIVGWAFAILGLCTWGIQRAGAQIVFSALVFQRVEKAFYGTAIGIFYLVSGVSTLISSSLCGHLADKGHFRSVFCLSGICAFLALGASLYLLNRTMSNFPELKTVNN